jgi:SpoVK/Ycf46/Vps4 family AAA+-type ATPase
MPGVEEREKIWRVQIHPNKTPLADDVDFRLLAERFPMSGGDIKNAVLKAANAAAAEAGPERARQIHQAHFERAIADVLAAKSLMQQSLFDERSATYDPPWRRPLILAMLLAGSALIAALTALAIVLLR